jgi:hypothetical protein
VKPHEYPDAAQSPDYDLAPRTINIAINGPVGSEPVLDLSMPTRVWEKLNKGQKDELVALLNRKLSKSEFTRKLTP